MVLNVFLRSLWSYVNWHVLIPAAVRQSDGTARLFTFNPASVGGSGKDIPLIMGLDAMEEKSSIIDSHQWVFNCGYGRVKCNFLQICQLFVKLPTFLVNI